MRRVAVALLLGLVGFAAPSAWAQRAEPAAEEKAPPPAKKKKPKAKSAMIKLTFRSSPSGAEVVYGRRVLGTTPFDLEWKRDTGPVDVVVKLPNHYKVNSRIYTLRDSTLNVQLTHERDGHKIYGYKAPIKVKKGDDQEDAPD